MSNLGVKTDLNYLHGRHNAKFGAQVTDTILTEKFTLGLTDPTFNPVCLLAARRNSTLEPTSRPRASPESSM